MARKVTTVYKVVRRSYTHGGLMSAIASVPLSWQVTYVPGRWVAPRHAGSLLFAFPNKTRALEFRNSAGFEVWRADAEVATKRMGFWQVTNGFAWMTSYFSGATQMARFWRRKTTPRLPTQTPPNTIGCRRIRLVKRVHAGRY